MNIHLNDEAVENDSDGRLINNMIRTRCWCCLGGRGSLPDLGWAVSAPESGERSQLTADGDQAETEIRMINVWSDPRSASSTQLSRKVLSSFSLLSHRSHTKKDKTL